MLCRPKAIPSCKGLAAPRMNLAAHRVHSRCQASARDFLADCNGLGVCRFIVIADGAILESVSQFSSVKYTDVPNRGTLATISTPDKSFECHINLSKVQQVKMAKTPAKAGDYDIYGTRFYGESDKMLLSVILHRDQGVYSEEAVQAWGQLQAKYGEAFTLE